MYRLLGLSFVLKLYGWLVGIWLGVMIVLSALLAGLPADAPGWVLTFLRSIAFAGLLAAVTLAVLGSRPLLWPALAWLARWRGQTPFPNINGEWKGDLSCNYPLIKQIHEPARREKPGFDPRSQHIDWGSPVTVDATITADLFRIGMYMRSELMTSELIAAWPLPSEAPSPPRLAYLYRANVVQTRADRGDVPSFEGAALVEVIVDKDKPGNPLRIEGKYWTNRAWDQAMNTAGEIRLQRISGRSEPVKGSDVEQGSN